MITRRRMIGSGAAVSALGFGSRASPAASNAVPHAATSPAPLAPAARPSSPLAVVVVDKRFDAAPALSRSLAAPDVPRLALPRDVLEFWHRQLAPLCATGRHAIGGVTTERGFFLLRTLAADHRLRVKSRRAHGALVSWVIGPK